MKTYKSTLVVFFMLICSLQWISCKLRKDSNFSNQQNIQSIDIRNSIEPQFVVKKKMIFKFYCNESEKIPDCKEFDVMRLENFLKASGLSKIEVEAYFKNIGLEKSYEESTKKLEELEAKYKKALKQKVELSNIQEREYKRLKNFYLNEIQKFQKSDAKNHLLQIRTTKLNPINLKARFEPDVGEVATGRLATCAIKLNGNLICWGENQDDVVVGWKEKVQGGELKLPVSSIYAAEFHFCAIGADDRLSCWGGDNVKQSSGWKEKVDKDELKLPLKSLSTGRTHTCAIGADGKLSCWGEDGFKQSTGWISLMQTGKIKTPIKLVSSWENDSCVVGSDDFLICWGEKSNETGFKPVKVENFKHNNVIAGGDKICAGEKDDQLNCWGTGIATDWKENVQEKELSLPLRFLRFGLWFGCAIGANYEVSCWGYDTSNVVTKLKEMVNKEEIKFPVRKLSVGSQGNCAIGSDRRIVCWGNDDSGQLSGRNSAGYKFGEFGPEDFQMDMVQLGFYEE